MDRSVSFVTAYFETMMLSHILATCTSATCNANQVCAAPNVCVCKDGWGGSVCDIR